MGKYDVAAIRDQIKKANGRSSDPDEFKPGKPKAGEPLNYRFFILPPVPAGTQLKSGITDKDMDLFYIQHGAHWIDNKPHPCPRLHDGSKCEFCEFGFKLMGETQDKDKRREIAKNWMPNTANKVNIFFTSWDGNPQELRGQVKVFNAGQQVFNVWEQCLMRDDAGDIEDPKAFGVFYDENNAFVFNLEASLISGQVSYTTSKFLATPQPMVRKKDGSPDEERIAKLLSLRHNLWAKVPKPDAEAIRRLANSKINGDDADGGFDHDESKKSEPPKTESKAKTEAKVETKTSVTSKNKTVAKEETDVVDLLDDVSSLADEGPIETKKEKAATTTKSKPAPEPDPEPETSNDVDGDIDDLLSQL